MCTVSKFRGIWITFSPLPQGRSYPCPCHDVKRVASILVLSMTRTYMYLTKYYSKNAGQNVELCEFVFDRISAEFALPSQ